MASFWREAKDDAGRTYYANTQTGESSWVKPEGFLGEAAASSSGGGDWKEGQDAEGRTYYANVRTGESSWTKPEGFDSSGSSSSSSSSSSAGAAAGVAAGAAGGAGALGPDWTTHEKD